MLPGFLPCPISHPPKPLCPAGEMRQAYLEKAESQKMKQKARERMQPKMGKLDIDYQVCAHLSEARFFFEVVRGRGLWGR